MASQKTKSKPLVIVESPAKARTIARFLGRDFVIEASVGHVRDLPANASEVPPNLKKEKWARLGIDVENGFQPLYVVPKDKREHIKRLKQLVRDASVVYLATDEDREGESISWHLVDELKPKVEVQRLVFHEITEPAIRHALEHPRQIDENLVEAQETRRLVDRLYGYSVSPLLWKKVRPKLSAGRVQSVAVRLVVEREKERIRFVPADYWGLVGRFQTAGDEKLEATLARLGEKRIALGKDFDPDTGKLAADAARDVEHLTEARAKELAPGWRVARRRSRASRRSPTPSARSRRSRRARSSRRPGGSSASPRSARCAPRSVSTRTATSPTCAPTRPRCRARR